VARERNPNRDKAKKTWLESGGKISTKELAEAAGVPEQRIRKWKSEDKWQQELDALNKPKRGGQRGNNNAAGHGAPKENKNAETHGAYARVHLEHLSPEEQEYIEKLTLDAEKNMKIELQLLFAKERDLSKKIAKYENENPNELFVDRVIEMLVPKSGSEFQKKPPTNEEMKTAMRTVIKASPFDRIMKLEAELNKTHGRILKLLDTIRAHEMDKKRLELDERKHTLNKQRAAGVYTVDPDTGELVDTESAEDVDGV